MVSESVFTTISNEYYNLTAAEKKTADYVMAHQSEVQGMSISELAAASAVAEATVSRFCKRLGYKGYNAFKLSLANSVASVHGRMNMLSGEVTEEDSFSDMCRKLYRADTGAITQTLALIDEETVKHAADVLESAGTVLCMGQGGSMILAEETAHVFATVSGKYFHVSGSHMQAIAAVNLKENDAVIFFSYSGATRDMLETLELVRSRGAKSILITRYPNSPGAAKADIVLHCGANESPLQLGSIAARISQLFIVDVLFSEVCIRHLDECRESRSRVANALADKHV